MSFGFAISRSIIYTHGSPDFLILYSLQSEEQKTERPGNEAITNLPLTIFLEQHETMSHYTRLQVHTSTIHEHMNE